MAKIYQKSFPGGKNAGFTLIEILVVVLIIGILAAVAVPQYQKAVTKSKLMKEVARLDAFYTAQQEYYLANGSYTCDREALSIEVPAGTVCHVFTTWGFMQSPCYAGACLEWNWNSGKLQRRCFGTPGDSLAEKICASLGKQSCKIDDRSCYLVGS